MTYYNHGASYVKEYEFTAFSEADLQSAGVSGGVSCGDTFTMPASASVCIKVKDDDSKLSGDGRWWSNDHAADRSHQTATILEGGEGDDVGNGGQIYAEKAFWVCDQDGNWFRLIEIEQEGSSGQFYSFDAKYGIPADGAELSVYSACEVGARGLSYSRLDAGECTPPPPVDEDCITIEAEDMDLCGYCVEDLDGASGGQVVRANPCAPSSSAKTTFQGMDGTYDFNLRVLDESDGQGTIKIYVNGELLETVVLDQDTGGRYGETGVFRDISIEDIALKTGDKITIVSHMDGHEFMRLDKIELCKDDKPLPAALGDIVWLDANRDGIQNDGEAGVEGITVQLKDAGGVVIATTNTDANGNYLFDNLEPGDYSVGFVLPAGFEFTTRDAGGDDAVDSDVDPLTGMTGTYTLEAGETDLTVDAGIRVINTAPDAMDDMGKVCATETVAIDVLANDSDADGTALLVAQIAGNDVSAGESVTLASGAVVTLNNDGTLSYDSSGASYLVDGVVTSADELLIGTQVSESFSYTVSDGIDIGTANVDVTICGAKNTLDTIAASLPAGGQAVLTIGSEADFFTVDLSGTGNAIFDGTFDIAYCVAAEIPITPGASYDVTFEVMNDPTTDLISNPENVGFVNWIINQDFGAQDNGDGTGETYTEGEIQGAIWGFTDGFDFIDDVPNSFGSDENSQEIYQAALDAGLAAQDFVPGEGDIVSILIRPDDPTAIQPLIVGIEFDSLAQDCVCV